MMSGCQDKEMSADMSNASIFQLPDPTGECMSIISEYISILCLYHDMQLTCGDNKHQ